MKLDWRLERGPGLILAITLELVPVLQLMIAVGAGVVKCVTVDERVRFDDGEGVGLDDGEGVGFDEAAWLL